MSNYEDQIKEKRIIESMKKGYMGLGGKFGKIAKLIGHPILEQNMGGSDYVTHENVYSLDNLLYYKNEEEIPYIYTDNSEEPLGGGFREERNYHKEQYSSNVMGWNFSGLSQGMNLEIMVKDEDNEIKVSYDGYKVYHEIKNELICFVPNKEWEQKIDILFSQARKRENEVRKVEQKDKINQAKKNKLNFLEKIRKKWGV